MRPFCSNYIANIESFQITNFNGEGAFLFHEFVVKLTNIGLSNCYRLKKYSNLHYWERQAHFQKIRQSVFVNVKMRTISFSATIVVLWLKNLITPKCTYYTFRWIFYKITQSVAYLDWKSPIYTQKVHQNYPISLMLHVKI